MGSDLGGGNSAGSPCPSLSSSSSSWPSLVGGDGGGPALPSVPLHV